MPNPESRFGHTVTMINMDWAIIFGGAVGTGTFWITNDLFCFDCLNRTWIQMRP